MAELTTAQYDALESAITNRTRVAIYRRGAEYVVVPERLRTDRGRELLESTHPATGDRLRFFLDEVDEIEVVR